MSWSREEPDKVYVFLTHRILVEDDCSKLLSFEGIFVFHIAILGDGLVEEILPLA